MHTGIIQIRPIEYTADDEDAEMDDDPILETDDAGVHVNTHMYVYKIIYIVVYICMYV